MVKRAEGTPELPDVSVSFTILCGMAINQIVEMMVMFSHDEELQRIAEEKLFPKFPNLAHLMTTITEEYPDIEDLLKQMEHHIKAMERIRKST